MRGVLIAALVVVSGAAAGHAQEADRRGETPAEAELLAHANLYRGALDLPLLERDDELSWHCLRHALYQDRNNVTGHPEDPKLPGYSDDGHAAGMASVLAYTDAKRSVDMWMDSFLHRIPVITPTGARAGVGWHSGKAVTSALLDTRRGGDPARGRDAELHWPPDGMTGVPTRMSREQPNPTPYPSSDQAGYPVTCTFHPRRAVRDASVKLWHGLTPISGFFSSPDRPTRHGAALQQNTICLIPEKPLPHGKLLRVEMRATVDGAAWSAEWTFTTGSRTAGVKWMERTVATRAARAAAEEVRDSRETRRAKIRDEKEARRALAIAVGVLRAVPDKGLANAIKDGRGTREALPEAMQPELDRALRVAERKLTTLVDAQLAIARQGGANANAAWNAAARLANGVDPWAKRVTAARKAGAGAQPATAGSPGTAAKPKVEKGWMSLLVDRLTNAWTGPAAKAGLRKEPGHLWLVCKPDPVTISYLYFTDDWSDYEVKAEVQVVTGAALILRARLEDGEYKGHYAWLDPTAAGQWVTLHATISGTTVRVTCGDQVISETCEQGKGGFIFAVQSTDEQLRVKNVRVKK